MNGVVAHVRSAHVAFAGNVKALVALSVIEVGQEHARANGLGQIPIVVGAEMSSPVGSGSVVVNRGSGNVRIELVSEQADLEVTGKVQTFNCRHGIVAEHAQTAVVVAAAACFRATGNMSTGVVTAMAQFKEGAHCEVVGQFGTVTQKARNDVVLDAGARVVTPLAAAGCSKETVTLAVAASQNGIDKEVVGCKVRGQGGKGRLHKSVRFRIDFA